MALLLLALLTTAVGAVVYSDVLFEQLPIVAFPTYIGLWPKGGPPFAVLLIPST